VDSKRCQTYPRTLLYTCNSFGDCFFYIPIL